MRDDRIDNPEDVVDWHSKCVPCHTDVVGQEAVSGAGFLAIEECRDHEKPVDVPSLDLYTAVGAMHSRRDSEEACLDRCGMQKNASERHGGHCTHHPALSGMCCNDSRVCCTAIPTSAYMRITGTKNRYMAM